MGVVVAMSRPLPGAGRSVLALAGFLAVCFAVSALGARVTSFSVDTWYQVLIKPSFHPPQWLFAPVWTALYAMIAVTGWRVWRAVGFTGARPAFAAYAVQLLLNLAWPFIFFGMRAIGPALAELALLWATIVITMAMFWRHDRVAGALLIPYAVWVAFAALLNGAILMLNPQV